MEESLVSIEHSVEKPQYVLLQPGTFPARQGQDHGIIYGHPIGRLDLNVLLEICSESRILAVDWETCGLDYSHPDFHAVGLGLAGDFGSAYIPWNELPLDSREIVRRALASHPGLIAHNLFFDGGVACREFDQPLNWHACTYALLAMLNNEGPPHSQWGLKAAQVNLLGWENSNEGELDEWLVTNGYYIGNRRTDNSPENLRTEYQAGKLRPDKGEMWRAPVDILGKYCCLDAESTYLLYTEILEPVCREFPGLEEFFHKEFMHLIQVSIEQKFHGIPMDPDKLHNQRTDLQEKVSSLTKDFHRNSEVSKHIAEIELEMRQDIVSKEPARVKKDGKVSLNWVKWKERLRAAEAGELEGYRFNLQSGPQLRELLYTRLGNEVRITADKGDPSVGIKALKHLGEIGKLLTERMWATKELSYVDKYIELTSDRPTIHPSFRLPGTVTGRLSSKEPNLQQYPKNKAMMGIPHARPGHVWVDLDFSALEPVVATEFSGDPNMMKIYGNDAPPNDIYLYVGAHIPGMREDILKTGYNPLCPTKETLARAKKECKHIRGICKTVTLAAQYGAGVNKVMQVLENDDVFLNFEEVQKIHSGYWNLFSGVKRFGEELKWQWRENGGYILNGIGRPMCVPENMTMDLLNRFVQSTGHDILTKYVYILTNLLNSEGVDWKPVIIDFHDATTIEVPEAQQNHALMCFNVAMGMLNEQLGGTIKLRGTPAVGYTLAEVKEPEE